VEVWDGLKSGMNLKVALIVMYKDSWPLEKEFATGLG